MDGIVGIKVLVCGSRLGIFGHHVEALRRCGCSVELVETLDVSDWYPAKKFHFETGGVFSESAMTRRVLNAVAGDRFDLVFVDGGRFIGPDVIRYFQSRGAKVVAYNTDAPYDYRDRFSWSLFKRSTRYYDMVVVMREHNVGQAYSCGAKEVMRVFMSADNVAHQPRAISDADRLKFASDVLFIGTYMEDRDRFLEQLINCGVPLTIYGNRWQKSRRWGVLRPHWKGGTTADDEQYAKLIQCSKVSLGLLSKGNKDQHTTRSMEIPALGGLLCAERTPEHQMLYREGSEAVFWSDASECASACRQLLNDDKLRNCIASAGRRRALQNGHFNDQVMRSIIQKALDL